jgi:hypothetical protein
MITIKNQIVHNIPFNEYLKLPGQSYSGLKGGFTTTPAMALGTKVHNHVLDGDDADDEATYEIGKVLMAEFGSILSLSKKEISYTCDMHYDDMLLPYKGRIDIKILDTIVDLKILSQPIKGSIRIFGYDKQITGYMLGSGATQGFIIAYNKVSKRCEVEKITPDYEFWKNIIRNYGKTN